MACLDTTVLIDLHGRGGKALQARARDRIAQLIAADEALTTTRFNVAEMWVGIERSQDREKERRAIETLFGPLVILEFGEEAAQAFGRITAHLQSKGSPAGDMDVLIASVALVNGHSIVTRDPKHFSGIPALPVQSY